MKKAISIIAVLIFSMTTSYANLKLSPNFSSSIREVMMEKKLNDTIKINASDLISKEIALGKLNYIIYAKKGKDAPAMNITW